MAKARCEWDALKIDPLTQKLHGFLDVLQKTAEEAFGSETQQFIETAIYAKCLTTLRKSSTGHTFRTNHLTTSYSIWKEK